MASQLTFDQYSNLNIELGNILSTGQYAYVNIFTDIDGTAYAVDSNGDQICGKQIDSISSTSSHADPATGEPTQPFISIQFSDGSTFVCTDNVDTCWYSIYGVPIPPRTF